MNNWTLKFNNRLTRALGRCLFSKNTDFPKKILTNEEIYEMLISDAALLGLSKKAVRKIEKAVLAKVYKGESK